MIKKQNQILIFKDQIGGARNLCGEAGSTELLYIFLTFCLLTLMSLLSSRMILHYKKNEQRQKAYLCLKESFENHLKAKTYIEYSNYAIEAALASIVVSAGASTAHAKTTISTIKKAQLGMLLHSYYKIYKNENCTTEQKLILISLSPISFDWKTLTINRHLETIARLKIKSKTFLYPSKSLANSDFYIKGTVSYKKEMKLTDTREYNLELLDSINQQAIISYTKSTFIDLKAYFRNPKLILKSFTKGFI